MRDHAVDPRRVYVAGLSAGGAAAAIMAQAYPDLYAAVGVHSGLACGAARDMPSAFAAMRQGAAAPQRSGRGPAADGNRRIVPTIVFHADKDAHGAPAQRRPGHRPVRRGRAACEPRCSAGRCRAATPTAAPSTPTPSGQPVLEQWLVHGGGHAWSGGSAAGSYTDPRGPDASREMLRFFLEHPHSTGPR